MGRGRGQSTRIRTRRLTRNHGGAIGNEIVVVDLRDQKAPVTPDDARAVAAHVPYDQLMLLQPARLPGTEAFVRIYNNDGSEAGACGNGMRCVASRMFADSDRNGLTFETRAGLLLALPRFMDEDVDLHDVDHTGAEGHVTYRGTVNALATGLLVAAGLSAVGNWIGEVALLRTREQHFRLVLQIALTLLGLRLLWTAARSAGWF